MRWLDGITDSMDESKQTQGDSKERREGGREHLRTDAPELGVLEKTLENSLD